uniref:Uncharacterized protein n=1 Tax=Anguilla anguilla TaxID=7936 RepID=A0A0E9P7H6_ANGAN
MSLPSVYMLYVCMYRQGTSHKCVFLLFTIK